MLKPCKCLDRKMHDKISKNAKIFAVEVKKEICSMIDKKYKLSQYTLGFHITNASICFSMLHEFTLEEFIPAITEKLQRYFYLFNLKFEDYSDYFHFDQNIWAECCHPFHTEIAIFRNDFDGEEWSRNDDKTIKSYVFSI